MHFVKTVSRGTVEGLEEDINKILSDNIKNKLVDIKFSSSTNGDKIVIYSAIIIFERPV